MTLVQPPFPLQRSTPWLATALSKPLAALMLSAWAAALAVIVCGAKWTYSIVLIGTTVFPLMLYMSRNPRLLLLMGLVFTAPLGLSVNFLMSTDHMGGAPAISISLCDFFMVPLLAFLLRDRVLGYRPKLRLSELSPWWLGLMALGACDVLQGPLHRFPAFELLQMLKCWLLFLVISNECVRQRQFEQVMLALVANVILNLLVAAAQFTVKHNLGLQSLGEASEEATQIANHGVYLNAAATYRVGGLLGHPNLFGPYLALLLPILTALVFTSYGRKLRWLFALTAICGCGMLILTLSRSSWFGFATAMLALLLVLWCHPVQRNRFGGWKLAMLAGGAIGVLSVAGTIMTRLTASDPGALDFRRTWVDIAWRMVQARPLLGFGLNTFVHQFAPYSLYSFAGLVEEFGSSWPTVHNIYMLVWAEQGTIGLLLLVGFMAQLLRIGLGNMRAAPSDKLLMLDVGALCGLLAIAIDGMASYFIRVPACGRTYFLIAGLVVAVRHWNQRNGNPEVNLKLGVRPCK